MALKVLKQGEKMPYDFWNYRVNPVVGFDYRMIHEPNRDMKKYNKT